MLGNFMKKTGFSPSQSWGLKGLHWTVAFFLSKAPSSTGSRACISLFSAMKSYLDNSSSLKVFPEALPPSTTQPSVHSRPHSGD